MVFVGGNIYGQGQMVHKQPIHDRKEGNLWPHVKWDYTSCLNNIASVVLNSLKTLFGQI